jgi:multidrug efflux pump subunit AcrA (membrane-fusion protein)
MGRVILDAIKRHHLATRLRSFSWAVCAMLLLAACSDQPTDAPEAQGNQGPAAVPVLVATAVQQAVPVTVRVIGTVQAYASVTIVPQVSTQLAQVHKTVVSAVPEDPEEERQ